MSGAHIITLCQTRMSIKFDSQIVRIVSGG